MKTQKLNTICTSKVQIKLDKITGTGSQVQMIKNQIKPLEMIVNRKVKGSPNKVSFSMIIASLMMNFSRIGRKELVAYQNLHSLMRKILKSM